MPLQDGKGSLRRGWRSRPGPGPMDPSRSYERGLLPLATSPEFWAQLASFHPFGSQPRWLFCWCHLESQPPAPGCHTPSHHSVFISFLACITVWNYPVFSCVYFESYSLPAHRPATAHKCTLSGGQCIEVSLSQYLNSPNLVSCPWLKLGLGHPLSLSPLHLPAHLFVLSLCPLEASEFCKPGFICLPSAFSK